MFPIGPNSEAELQAASRTGAFPPDARQAGELPVVYRELEVGEIVREGDEYKSARGEWIPVQQWGYHIGVSAATRYRRQQSTAEATDALSNAVTGALEGIAWLYVGLAFAVFVVALALAIYAGGAK